MTDDLLSLGTFLTEFRHVLYSIRLQYFERMKFYLFAPSCILAMVLSMQIKVGSLKQALSQYGFF